MTNKPDFMNRFIYSDFMDEIIQYRLKTLIDDTVENIREYKSRDKLEPHQQEDLDQWLKDIKYLTDTYIYFSGQYNYRPEFYDD
jgi:hypothetical protein